MKKYLRKYASSKPYDFKGVLNYFVQLSIAAAGVVLSIWITGSRENHSKQKDVHTVMHLIAEELNHNLKIIGEYRWLYNQEKRVAECLKQKEFSLEEFPIDTVESYWRRIMNGMGKPYLFRTTEFVKLQNTNLASEIGNTELVNGILLTYNDIEAFEEKIGIFFQRRAEMLASYQLGAKHPSHSIGIRENFTEILRDKEIQGWITAIPYALEDDFFDKTAKELELLIAILEKRYS